MFRQKEWQFSGQSGEQYSFNLCSKSDELPVGGGIYIAAYTHPRGHRAGFQVNVLRLGAVENLRSAMAALRDDACLQEECWNCIFILELAASDRRQACFEDLVKEHPGPC